MGTLNTPTVGKLTIRLTVAYENPNTATRNPNRRVVLASYFDITKERAQEQFKEFMDYNPHLQMSNIEAVWEVSESLFL